MFQRAITIYPWAALFIAFAPLGVRPAAGIGAALAVAIANLALVAAGVWLVGARAGQAGRARAHPVFLPGTLLLAGPLALLALAAVTGEPTASRPAEFLVNATGLLLGALLLLLGFTLLAARLWAAGERALPALGLAGLTVGSALWVANLVARYAVVASGAAGLHAAIEGDYWVASRYLLGLPGEPSWLAFLLVWLDMLQLAYLVAAYLCAAAFAAALARAGWLGQVGGRITTALGLALALAVVLGILLAAAGSRGARCWPSPSRSRSCRPSCPTPSAWPCWVAAAARRRPTRAARSPRRGRRHEAAGGNLWRGGDSALTSRVSVREGPLPRDSGAYGRLMGCGRRRFPPVQWAVRARRRACPALSGARRAAVALSAPSRRL